jgi:hypothetical protein
MFMSNEIRSSLTDLIMPESHQYTASYFSQEYTTIKSLFEAQPVLTQRFIKAQAQGIAEAVIQPQSQIHFMLPDLVARNVTKLGQNIVSLIVPSDQRKQSVSGRLDWFTHSNLLALLRVRLDEIEASSYEAVSICAHLIRFAIATYLVHNLLPAGRSVVYRLADNDEIPTIPAGEGSKSDATINSAAEVVKEGWAEFQEAGEELTQVPYNPAARFFFLPQWVAFDDENKLLVNTVAEAKSYLTSMQHFMRILDIAVFLTPYMIADEQYQLKRYGMLGQIINQGRALASYETHEIIATIRHRAAAKKLDRGLSLSLPYFDDQALEMKSRELVVIPAGRIMFVPGFVVLAAREEQVKVVQDAHLSRSTRNHLLKELQMLELSFYQQREKLP